MHIDGWDCLNSKHEQMRKIMISSHHKVRFEPVVATNDWILVLSLLHHFVLTLPPSHIWGCDQISQMAQGNRIDQTTATPTMHWVTNDHYNCVWMSSSSRWRNVSWSSFSGQVCSPLPLWPGLSPGVPLASLGAAGTGAVQKLPSRRRGPENKISGELSEDIRFPLRMRRLSWYI